MNKLKGIKKKLRRLEASMQKDARKLAKLQRRVETALKAESGRLKPISGVRNGSTSVSPAASKKRALTPEGRAKLSALMKARWAAKRAATVPFVDPQRVEA